MKKHEIPYEIGEEVFVNIEFYGKRFTGVYTIVAILEDNLDPDGEYPIAIEEIPCNVKLSEVRKLTKLEKALK